VTPARFSSRLPVTSRDGRSRYPNNSRVSAPRGAAQTGTWWRLQATVPYIRRSYLRPDHAQIERGTVSGVGDATLSGNFRVWQPMIGEHRFTVSLLAGLELPTGNADHLGDEIGHHFHHHAGFPDSGIHGHDLALGSGSTDYLGGVDANWEHGAWFARASLQYKLRRPGKFGYRLDDAWEAGPGYRFVRTEAASFSAQALVSGEHKGFDTLGGTAQVDTGFSARYAGFRLAGERGRHLTAEGSVEIPIRLRTSETMVVPDYRVRAAVTWRL
jgi:hypothetical protein